MRNLLEKMILEAVFRGDYELAEKLKNLMLDNIDTRELAYFLVDQLSNKVHYPRGAVTEIEEFEMVDEVSPRMKTLKERGII